MQVLSDGGYAISDRIGIGGNGSDVFVFGRGWLLEVVDLEGGDYFFYSDGRRVRPASGHFGVFYPSFSFVRPYVGDVTGHVVGVGAVHAVEGLPPAPVLFETDFKGKFTETDEAVEVFKAA